MHEYIRARTAFFDRVVVASIDRGITQVVIGGAGYDGRAFRYAKPGVRWFEVDHPATQADKLERITRLGLATAQLSFIPADFTADPVAEPLLAAGLDPARPALFLFEGVAVYLERPVIERVLAEFREVTPAGSPLAISVSTSGATSQTRASVPAAGGRAGRAGPHGAHLRPGRRPPVRRRLEDERGQRPAAVRRPAAGPRRHRARSSRTRSADSAPLRYPCRFAGFGRAARRARHGAPPAGQRRPRARPGSRRGDPA